MRWTMCWVTLSLMMSRPVIYRKRMVSGPDPKVLTLSALLGPWIETDINPHNRNISLRVNGELKQDSNTENLIFSVEKIS